MRFRAALLAAALTLSAPALAQDAAPAAASSPQSGRVWYEGQVTELASVLGGAHYLRVLCSGRDDQQWRNFMRGVMEREPAMQATLRDAFNEGYRTEEARFPACSTASQQTEAELRARGIRIAGALRVYGGARQ